jgi:kynurenine 3-monooxygenase
MENKIAIIGAGLVGSLWASLLRQEGLDVTVFEKRPDARLESGPSGRSINLIVTSRGLYGLERAGLLKSALEITVPVYGRQIHSREGALSYQPYGLDSECNYAVSRSELNKFLVTQAEKAGIPFVFNSPLSECDLKHKVLTFEGSKTFHYDTLFAADGAGSRVRKELVTSFPDRHRETTEWLEADYKELHLPAASNGEPLLDPKALHIWPRGTLMLMALMNRDKSFTLTLYMPKKGRGNTFESVQTLQQASLLFQCEFQDLVPLLPDCAEQYLASPQSPLGTIRCNRWVFESSAALLGDAAHAMVPFFGQGMNSGFEDCTDLLDLWLGNTRDWPKALAAYNETRVANANAIADMALENWTEMRDKVGDPRFLLQKKVELFLEKRFPTLYKSRYGLIAYSRVPYTAAKKIGELQGDLLKELCEGLHSVESLNLSILEPKLRAFRRSIAPFLETK